jgi:hypothetical protein
MDRATVKGKVGGRSSIVNVEPREILTAGTMQFNH